MCGLQGISHEVVEEGIVIEEDVSKKIPLQELAIDTRTMPPPTQTQTHSHTQGGGLRGLSR